MIQIDNVLFNQLENGLGTAFAEKMIAAWGVKNMYTVVYEQRHDPFSSEGILRTLRETILFTDAQTANYEEYIYYDEQIPLDKHILDNMSIYENEVLKMMDRMLSSDRSTANRMLQYFRHVRYWNTLLDKGRIQLYVQLTVSHDIYDHVIFRLCKLKRIPTLTCDYIPVDTAHFLYPMTSYERFDRSIVERIRENAKKDNVFLNEDMEREYSTHVNAEKPVVDGGRIKAPGGIKLQKAMFFRLYRKNHRDAVRKVFTHFADRAKIGSLLRYYNKISENPDYNCRYVYFPLHVQPEASTSPVGGWYVHQYLAIEMLSYYLPADVQVYVKEHPSTGTLAVNSRVKAEYDEIRNLRNVKLIDINTNTFDLLEHSAAVASITGTVGYEALYKRKPFFMFGDQFHKYSPNALNIRTNEDCKEAIRRVFYEGFEISDNDIRSFLKEISDNGIRSEARWWTRKTQEGIDEANRVATEFLIRFERLLADEQA